MDNQTESMIETLASFSYDNGEIDKMFFISSELMKKAEEYFSKGKDSIAIAFRDEALIMRDSAQIYKTTRDKNKQRIDDIWKILDEKIPNIQYDFEE